MSSYAWKKNTLPSSLDVEATKFINLGFLPREPLEASVMSDADLFTEAFVLFTLSLAADDTETRNWKETRNKVKIGAG